MSLTFTRISKMAAPAATAATTAGINSYFFHQKISSDYGRRLASTTAKSVAETLLRSANKKPTTVSSNTIRFASTKEVPSKSLSPLQWYESHLEANPVPTKMVTGAFLWGLGDLVAQVVPPMLHKDEVDVPGKDAPISNKSTQSIMSTYDYARTGRAVFFGFALHSPIAHVHYNFLETLTIRTGITGLGIPVFKAFMEQFVYWSWFSNTLYHGAMGAMQGMNVSQIYDRIADVLWETQKAQWAFWIPVQLLNFRFVPVRHQLNVVLLTSIVWTALLSAWYPPTDDGKKKENKTE
mmetsp:Transcript_19651/g.24289  ORF Transcript_19651/g.24289 Transcript_19651/m.24289 type:complete len:294 (+) Transcript_19651:90-971(+)|eukprot:CAMPEP_0172511470 /NCGR_PEP_ID=MMETSP1066-20121228/236631_1 /TAXON_ID=671091 /ORGANISM="Coscinodiscus wailesii, Strain CCMP2513" /LENGTH=293 /DNA_ID=CAMNT_0013290847 /DNA_START=84 /DNA_END=965 /DNA_ORIENTATION=-